MSGRITHIIREPWSPYVAGALFGFITALSGVIAHQMLGASASFVTEAGIILKSVAPRLTNNIYYKYVMPPQLSWQMLLMAGALIGAFTASKLSGDFGWRWVPEPDPQWRLVFGPSRLKRALVVFISGILIEFGARIAGGCTSGLAVSGGVQLSPAAFLFVAAVFATGIPTIMLLYRDKF